MTYQANIPLPTDLISNSQSDIKDNFQALGNTYPVDHVNFNDPGDGYHKQVTFYAPLGANPGRGSPIASAYTKASSVSSISDLYYQNGNMASDVVQVTGGGITAAAYVIFAGNTGVASVAYNATVSRTSMGVYVISFTRNFSTSNYLPLLSANGSGFNGLNFNHWSFISAASFQFEITDTTTGNHVDPGQVCCAFFGTLA